MTDFSHLHKLARHDIRICIQAWSETLRKLLANRLAFLYATGSAIKKWRSPIDYVPMLSDVDIHLRLHGEQSLFSNENAIEEAIRISAEHEHRFYELEPAPLHFPRSQIIIPNEKDPQYVPPRHSQIQPVTGTPSLPPEPPRERVREIDRANLKALGTFLNSLPMALVDRAGFYYWSLIRRMVWYVSPAPVRLLSQSHDDPLEVWGWNRTRIVEELEQRGLESIAFDYQSFYMAGWDLFLSEFKDKNAFRAVVTHGYRVLAGCLKALRAETIA